MAYGLEFGCVYGLLVFLSEGVGYDFAGRGYGV